MKKLLTVMLMVFVVLSVLCFTACDGTPEDVHTHQIVSISAKDATCTEAGNSAYYKCEGCNKYFSDALGVTEIAENSWVIQANGHTAVKTDAHEATCTEAGNSAYYKCSVCNKYFSDADCKTEIAENSWVIEANDHTAVKTDAREATCTEAGNSAYYKCSVCNKYFSDADCKTEIAENSWVIRANGHTGVLVEGQKASATEGWKDYYKCSACNKYFTDSKCENPIADLEAWKVGEGKIGALSKLATPTLTADANGISWSANSSAVKFQVKVNDGEFADATSYAFATEVGTYTIKVKAIGDNQTYLDSEEATFTYEVKQASITATKSASDTATISSIVGGTLQVKQGDNFVDVQATIPYTYTTTTTGTLTVKVKGGYDAENKIYYLDSAEKSVNLVAKASNELVIEDAEDKEDADLTDTWVIKKYSDGWVDCQASVVIGDYNGSNCVVAKCWYHQTFFKYSTTYSATDAYNTLAFDMKGDGVNEVKLQISNSQSGIYATYPLGTLPAYWQHFEISMTDTKWKINFQGQDYSFTDVISTIGMAEVNEILPYCDTISFLFKGADANWSSCKMYFDNVELINNATPATSITQPLFNLANVYTVANANGVVFKLQITGNTTAILSSLNLQNNVSANVNYAIGADYSVTLTDVASSGAGITAVGQIIDNGAKISLTSATGAMKDYFTTGMVFNRVVSIDDFENYTATGTGIDKNNVDPSKVSGLRMAYFGEYYSGTSTDISPLSGANWRLIGATDYITLDTANGLNGTKAMKVRSFNGGAAKYITMANISGQISGGVVPSFATSFGSATTFSMWVKASDSKDITIKVALIYQASLVNNEINEQLSYTQFTITKASGWNHIELPASGEVYGYAIIVNANWAGDYYLLIDNVELYDANPYAEYVSPEINLDDYEELNICEDFSSYSVNSGSATTPASVFTKVNDFYVRNDSGSGYNDSKYMTAKYANTGTIRTNTITYTPATAGLADKVEVAIANNRNTNALAVTIVVKVYNVNDEVVLEETFTVDASADWVLKSFTFEKTAVKKMSVTVTTTATPVGDAYLKLDNFTLGIATPIIPDANLNMDFEDAGTMDATYTGTDWVSSCGEKAVTSQMRIKADNNSKKVLNGYVDTTLRGYYYVPTNVIGNANYFSIDLGNYFGSSAISYKLVLVDTDNGLHYLAGSATEFASLAKQGSNSTGNKVFTTYEYYFDTITVKCFYMIVKVSSGSSYIYFDNVKVQLKNLANLTLDFEDAGAIDGYFTDSNWVQSCGEKIVTQQMRVKADNNNKKVVNGYVDTNVRKYIYYPAETIGLTNYFSIDLGNYFGSSAIGYKIALIDTEGNTHYLAGSDGEYAVLAKQGSNSAGNKTFTTYIYDNFGEIEVAAFYIQAQVASGSSYIYFDNVNVKYVYD